MAVKFRDCEDLSLSAFTRKTPFSRQNDSAEGFTREKLELVLQSKGICSMEARCIITADKFQGFRNCFFFMFCVSNLT